MFGLVVLLLLLFYIGSLVFTANHAKFYANLLHFVVFVIVFFRCFITLVKNKVGLSEICHLAIDRHCNLEQ